MTVSHAQPRRPPQPTRRLPIVFRALDVEGKTKPVPTLVCPVRADVMTVGNCGRCAEFKHIEFTADNQPVLCCSSVAAHGCEDGGPRHVQDFVSVPVVCTTSDTTLDVIQSYLLLGTRLDALPVLDLAARPIGFITIQEARRLVASGIPLSTTLSEVMSRQFVCVLPETSLEDAAARLVDAAARQLFAVAADGTFLGLVPRPAELP